MLRRLSGRLSSNAPSCAREVAGEAVVELAIPLVRPPLLHYALVLREKLVGEVVVERLVLRGEVVKEVFVELAVPG